MYLPAGTTAGDFVWKSYMRLKGQDVEVSVRVSRQAFRTKARGFLTINGGLGFRPGVDVV